ncbi:cytochrome c oxidase subunit II [Candidatus Halocynthiibacter alkanivorans]|uniref:cytochrome c oxidase subunit II n=1 Tax=Candidatus Halocynthiibacter alkanivorans TaxID=2267619 RepID=UPI003AF3F7B3
MRTTTFFKGLMAATLATTLSGVANAQAALDGLEIVGAPTPRGTGFQPAGSNIARQLQSLDWLLLVVSAAIVVFVTGLMIYIMMRYNRRKNPTPATFTHHSVLEIAWTIIPILVLVVIGAFSLPVLFYSQEIPKADLTIKAVGNQWYWDYEYPDSEFGFSSYMLAREDLEAAGYDQSEYLLATDTAVVVPVNKTVVVQVTAADVIHAWAVPALGVKQDGVPGRLAELWFRADKEGVYFGQCSELCGKDHSYMPITVKVVSQEAYDAWLKGAIEEFAGLPAASQNVKLASAE